MNRYAAALVYAVFLVLVGCVQNAPAAMAGTPGRVDLVIGQTGNCSVALFVLPRAGPWERRAANDLVYDIKLMIDFLAGPWICTDG